ncbi:GntR family transcriptional regulator [Zongyangia hominis]|uniref:GntR family transcriptional regulator n=1 Tax=Zongyangia hominis TaxID=2763677 RepID=A0A926IB98_9FIRM|nr:GntR family transcriptional regulator [Zongyangia hominis]MBC8569895.1 GntR family transcriptional regulator [Zongyangia hominis]
MENRMDDFKLDRDTPVPLYYQLKQYLIGQIRGGKLKVGDMLPTEFDLCEKFGVSRPTVRQAMSEMVAEGYLYRHKGRGTFVSKPKLEGRFFQKLQSYNVEMTQKGLEPATEVLNLKMVEDAEDACVHLGLEPQSKCILLERLRFADGEPMVYLETFMPYDRFGELLEVDFSTLNLYQELEERFHIKIYRARRVLEAIAANEVEAKLLQIKEGEPICYVTTVAYTKDEIAVEYSRARYRGDRNKFSIDLYTE